MKEACKATLTEGPAEANLGFGDTVASSIPMSSHGNWYNFIFPLSPSDSGIACCHHSFNRLDGNYVNQSRCKPGLYLIRAQYSVVARGIDYDVCWTVFPTNPQVLEPFSLELVRVEVMYVFCTDDEDTVSYRIFGMELGPCEMIIGSFHSTSKTPPMKVLGAVHNFLSFMPDVMCLAFELEPSRLGVIPKEPILSTISVLNSNLMATRAVLMVKVNINISGEEKCLQYTSAKS